MDNLGTEIGHKMRSAVKAKLIELGTGGASGYIDDELPDYVMIMVANKRSKQQMTEDLMLFLGENTDEFVTWLHTVLEKLQEVTLSTTAIGQKSKRKSSESIDKRDKKDKKKKLKRNHKIKENEAGLASSSASVVIGDEQPSASITDVFAEHLIQKAQKNTLLESSVNVKTKNESAEISMEQLPVTISTPDLPITTADKSVDEFDIPTISEIAKTAAGISNRRRDLNELAELQRKINQAKKHLKALGTEESEDEDFININDGEELQEDENLSKKLQKTNEKSNSGPIVDTVKSGVVPLPAASTTSTSASTTPVHHRTQRIPITFHDESKTPPKSPPPAPPQQPQSRVAIPAKKRSIMERLGVRPANRLSSSASASGVGGSGGARRSEKEIYVPVFRRRDDDKKLDRSDRDREKGLKLKQKNDQRDLRNRVREKEKLNRNESKELAIKNKVGSRIIVAPPKPVYDEDAIEVPVNSVVKVQPRPTIPSNKQANKNLLLRAVAEAQKSTALVQPRKEARATSSSSASSYSNRQSQKLYTKSSSASYRDSISNTSSKFNKDQSNIVIEVSTERKLNVAGKTSDEKLDYISDEYVEDDGDSDAGYVYIPINMSPENSDDEMERSPFYEPEENRTQFVITINEDNSKDSYVAATLTPTATPTTAKPQNGVSLVAKTKMFEQQQQPHRLSSPLRLDSTTQKVNKLIIKNDTEDEEELRKEVEQSTIAMARAIRRSKRSNVSPIKFDITDESSAGGLTTVASTIATAATILPKKRSKSREYDEKDATKDRHDDKVVIKRSDSTSKYDNLPPLLSAITSTVNDVSSTGGSGSNNGGGNNVKKLHQKERCKYYPGCGKGDNCEFIHPTSLCKTFPNCKYGDKCLYIHPKCKFDLTCNRLGCNFTHTQIVTAAPPLSSHVVPVTNYKSISTTTSRTQSSIPAAMCKFYPNCTNTMCTFYHPKPCRFGKNCNNKVECNFYHFGIPGKDKLKWVASNV